MSSRYPRRSTSSASSSSTSSRKNDTQVMKAASEDEVLIKSEPMEVEEQREEKTTVENAAATTNSSTAALRSSAAARHRKQVATSSSSTAAAASSAVAAASSPAAAATSPRRTPSRTPSTVGIKRSASVAGITSPSIAAAASSSAAAPPSSSSDGCAICLESILHNPASLSHCRHQFCFNCINEWLSQISSTCPLCKREVTEVTHYGIERSEEIEEIDEDVSILPSPPSHDIDAPPRQAIKVKIPRKLQRETYEAEEDENLPPEILHALCAFCAIDEREDVLLLCETDGCTNAYHTYCVGLGEDVPEGSWHCPSCVERILEKRKRQQEKRREKAAASASAGRRDPRVHLDRQSRPEHRSSLNRMVRRDHVTSIGVRDTRAPGPSKAGQDFAAQMAAALSGWTGGASSSSISDRRRPAAAAAASSSSSSQNKRKSAASSSSSSAQKRRRLVRPPSHDTDSDDSDYDEDEKDDHVGPMSGEEYDDDDDDLPRSSPSSPSPSWRARQTLQQLDQQRKRFLLNKRKERARQKREDEEKRIERSVSSGRPVRSAAESDELRRKNQAMMNARIEAARRFPYTPIPTANYLSAAVASSSSSTASQFTAPRPIISRPVSAPTSAAASLQPIRRRIPKKTEAVEMNLVGASTTSSPSSLNGSPPIHRNGVFTAAMNTHGGRTAMPPVTSSFTASSSVGPRATPPPFQRVATPYAFSSASSSSSSTAPPRPSIAPFAVRVPTPPAVSHFTAPLNTPTNSSKTVSPTWNSFAAISGRVTPTSSTAPLSEQREERKSNDGGAGSDGGWPFYQQQSTSASVASTPQSQSVRFNAASLTSTRSPLHPVPPPSLPPIISFDDFERETSPQKPVRRSSTEERERKKRKEREKGKERQARKDDRGEREHQRKHHKTQHA